MSFRRVVTMLSLLAPLGVHSTADASDPILCPIGDCCTFCFNPSCSAQPDHPDEACWLGSKVELWEACDMQRCIDEAATRYPDHPLTINAPASGALRASECIQHVDPNTPEVNDGYDNNCDGQYAGDECNGKDDDNDGIPDDDTGSCAERHLFVPFCWRPLGMTVAQQHEELSTSVERWESWFQSRSALSECGKRQVWYEAADMDAIVVSDPAQRKGGAVDCPIQQPLGGGWTGTESLITALTRWLKATGKYDLNDWDIITFVRNPDAAATVKGFVPFLGAPFIHMTTGGSNPLYEGEYFAWTHEYGHTLGLKEEYEKIKDTPNPLKPEFGCDPGAFPDDVADTWSNLGTCCHPHPAGCRTDVGLDDPEHCKNKDPLGRGYVCDGNLALDLEGWQWGDPAPSPYGNGRSIMSWTKAPGWDAGDLDTGEGSTRGWSQPAWDHFGQVGIRCSTQYAGAARRVQARAQMTSGGALLLIDQEISVGRVGPQPPTNNMFTVELRDQNGTLLGSQGVDPVSESTLLDVDAPRLPPEAGDASPVWLRVPVGANVNGPVRYTVFDEGGTAISQVTGGGSAPVARASDVVVECTAPEGTAAALDASASSDPDGDSLYFSWSATPPATLSEPSAATTTGLFPLGVSSVSVTVSDGARLSSGATAQVTVRDTTAPTVSPSLPSVSVCTPQAQTVTIPTPVVSDTCNAVTSISGAIVRVRGKNVAPLPITGNQVVLPVGEHVVRWTVRDAAGNTRSSEFSLAVQHTVSQTCCSPNQTYITGTTSSDILIGLPGAYCVNAQAGFFDLGLTLFGESDFIAGGRGFDALIGAGGNDVIQSGPGGGLIQGGALGSLHAYGGSGADTIDASLSTSATLHGAGGNDRLTGSLGNDTIVPGGGSDNVSASLGNDTIVVYNVCELGLGETIDGGLGNDTLVSPVSRLDLLLRGVFVIGVEQFVVDTSKAHLSDCF